MKFAITTIKPSMPAISFKPRTSEGSEEKPTVYVLQDLPAEIANCANDSLRAFAARAWNAEVYARLKQAIKEGKEEFTLSIADAYAETKREFTITRKDLEEWLDSFALGIVQSAIAAKAGMHKDSPKVVKKALAYKEIMLAIASRQIMSQDQIDACIKVLELLSSSGLAHAYTDNVAQGLAKKQERLDEFLASGQDSEEEIDF